MKKKIIGLVATVSLFGTLAYANNFSVDGLGFTAPTIIGKTNIFQPVPGEIVYDQADSTFYGHDHNGQWQAFGGASAGAPTGVISAFAGINAPAGYLICDGSPVSRITYAELYAVIGDSFGAGDGINTFNLPDLRGRFLRGLDTTTTPEIARDADRATRTLGSVQEDLLKSHTHTSYGVANNPGTGPSLFDRWHDNNSVNGSYATSATGGAETRPKNVAVNYIIKI